MKQPTAAERLASAITSLLIRIDDYCKEAAESPVRIGLCIANQKYAPQRRVPEEILERLMQKARDHFTSIDVPEFYFHLWPPPKLPTIERININDPLSLDDFQLTYQVKETLLENAEGKFIGTKDMNGDRIRLTLWGYRDRAKFYVFRKPFKEHLCDGYDTTQAAKILIANNVLMAGSGGKSSRTERIPAHHKQPDRFYVIDLGKQGNEKEDLDASESNTGGSYA